ncbi:MAG: heat-inducible transcription repressor HrcA [Clostridia bacterium]|nr:heat-inducible transcription repressor HrcA [Clostridia bacterium]
MELSDRKKIILGSLIKYYIKTGEPVGSKSLLELTGLGVSPATLRNEMSELCDLGYLCQPHTSAGRQPTSFGYSFYFEKLMNRREVPYDLQLIIDNMLNDAAKDPENLASVAGQLLSDLTGFPTLMATVTKEETFVKRVNVLSMGRRTVLLLLITSDGIARSRICRSAFNLAPDALSHFEKLVSYYIVGTELIKFSPVFLQALVSRTGDLSLFLMPLLSSVFEMVEELQSKSVHVKGESNVLKCYGNDYDSRSLLTLLTQQDKLFPLLTNTRDDIEIVFGDQTDIEALRHSSLVVAKYRLGDKDIGRIGVIGPVRMAYEQLVPSVEYFALKLGSVMTQAMRDLEE